MPAPWFSWALLPLIWSAQPPPAEYKEALEQAQAAQRKGEHRAAQKLCQKAIKLSGQLRFGGAEASRASLYCGDFSLAEKRYLAAAKHYQKAGHLAVSEVSLRRRALRKRRRALQLAKRRSAAKQIDKFLAYDRQLLRLAKQPRVSSSRLKTVLKELSKAQQEFKIDRDYHRVSYLRALKELIKSRSGKKQPNSKTISSLSGKKYPPATRLLAYSAQYYLQESQKNYLEAAKAAIYYDELRFADLPAERRRYTRSTLKDRICKTWGRAEDDHQVCTRLEAKLTGNYSFTNYAKARRKGRRSPQDIHWVHAQGIPALENCILEVAKKEPDVYVGVQVNVSWVVDREGRAGKLEIRPKRYLSDLSPCLNDRLSWLRYHRVTHQEAKQISVPFRLNR